MSRVFDPARHPSGTVKPAIGGKAENLCRSQQQECRVPGWVAVPAEAFFEALRKRSFTWLRRIVFRRVLRNARKGVKNRENMRFARTRIYGVLRELIQAMGRHLVRVDALDDAYDIFYLTIDEVRDYIKGVPAIVGIPGLLDRLQDGQVVTMNGQTGIIQT